MLILPYLSAGQNKLLCCLQRAQSHLFPVASLFNSSSRVWCSILLPPACSLYQLMQNGPRADHWWLYHPGNRISASLIEYITTWLYRLTSKRNERSLWPNKNRSGIIGEAKKCSSISFNRCFDWVCQNWSHSFRSMNVCLLSNWVKKIAI